MVELYDPAAVRINACAARLSGHTSRRDCAARGIGQQPDRTSRHGMHGRPDGGRGVDAFIELVD
jgi:hypothetical protein